MVNQEKKVKLEELLHALPREKRKKLYLSLAEQEKNGDLPPELAELFEIANALEITETAKPTVDDEEKNAAGEEEGLLLVRKVVSLEKTCDEEKAQDSDQQSTPPESESTAEDEQDASFVVLSVPRATEKQALVLLPLEPTQARPRNAMHAFFAPLKGMVTDPPPYTDRIPGLVCSNSIPLIWRLLNEEDEAATLQRAWHAIEKIPVDVSNVSVDTPDTAICVLHEAGLSLMQRILARCTQEGPYRENILFRLGGEAVFADMEELVGILGYAGILAQFAERTFAQSALSSCEDPATHVAHQLRLLKQDDPDALRYGQFYCLSHISLTADALLISQALQSDNQFKDEEAELLSRYILDDLTVRADWLEQVGVLKPMERPAVRIASHYIRNVKRAAVITHDSWWREWEETFAALMKRADYFSDIFCVASEEVVSQCLRRETGGCEYPDLSWALDGPILDAQMRQTRLALDFLCVISDLYPVNQDLRDKIVRYSDDLLELMAVAGGERYRVALKLVDLLHLIMTRLCDATVVEHFMQKRLSLKSKATQSRQLNQPPALAGTNAKTVRFI